MGPSELEAVPRSASKRRAWAIACAGEVRRLFTVTKSYLLEVGSIVLPLLDRLIGVWEYLSTNVSQMLESISERGAAISSCQP